MSYSVRYTPEAMRDMDDVWDGVYEASKSSIVCVTVTWKLSELF